MRSLGRALGLFTVVPVPHPGELDRAAARAALRWLPLVGALLGAVAGLPMAAIITWAPRGLFVGAVLAVAVLALATRALHLDGLADTVDGLGSGAPAPRALEIMRRSDIGPFGVVALVLVLVLDVAALASLPAGRWTPVAALAVAAATGRLAVLTAAHPTVPSARAAGFGAFVAGSASTAVVAGATVATLGFGGLLGWAVGAGPVGWPVAQVIALVAAAGLRWHTTRRLGGVTGDVFGALIEVGTAITLVGLALG